MTPFVASLVIVGAGLAIALALAAIGVVRVARIGAELKERIETYRSLPVIRFVDEANVKVARANRGIEAFPSLLYRANRALAHLTAARSKAVAIASSPSALWRLGELIVTGK